MKPTLFLLAAGMGSRYGGLKQLDGLGPNGETIMDYSIYDAIQAGFGKIVWVIRKDFEEQFRTQILSKYEDKIPCELCFQSNPFAILVLVADFAIDAHNLSALYDIFQVVVLIVYTYTTSYRTIL